MKPKRNGGISFRPFWDPEEAHYAEKTEEPHMKNAFCPDTPLYNPGDLEIYMETEGKKRVEPGKYRVYAGGNCMDERVSAEIEL
jgi:hypothetical protein